MFHRALIATVCLACGLHAATPDPDKDSRLDPFRKNLQDYVKLRNSAEMKVGAMPTHADARAIEAHQPKLAAAIQAGRPTAQPGDVFTAEGALVFKSILTAHFSGPKNANSRKISRQGNPLLEREVPDAAIPTVKVNAVYARSASVSSLAPSVLMSLPKLPDGLQYRFVGRALLLVDSRCGLIVDFIPDATPIL